MEQNRLKAIKAKVAGKMKSAKCEVCGKGHKDHASYVYKSGNL